MPRCLDPEQMFDIVLDGDKGKSPEPTFVCRSLTLRQFRNCIVKLQGIREAADQNAVISEALDVIEDVVVGWRNMIDPRTGKEIKFTPGTAGDLLDIEEAVELVQKITMSGRLSEDESKKSELPHSSDAVNSVKDAEELAPVTL